MARWVVSVQGDTWDWIAKRELGSEMLMHALLAANPRYRRLVVFPAGLRLRLPPVESRPEEAPPPWKRG